MKYQPGTIILKKGFCLIHKFQTLSVDMAEDMTPPSKAYHNHVMPNSNTNHVNFMPQYGYSDPNSQLQTPINSQDLLQPHIPNIDPSIPSVSIVQDDEKPLILQPQTNISQPGPSNLSTQAPNVMSSRFSLR